MSLEALKSFFSEGNAELIEEHEETKETQDKPILTGYIEREKQNRELYYEVASNIKESERLRAKINKDFKAAAPREQILKDCLKCISLMTGDSVFYNQNIKYFK